LLRLTIVSRRSVRAAIVVSIRLAVGVVAVSNRPPVGQHGGGFRDPPGWLAGHGQKPRLAG
jgi:hypothetical protein